MMKVYVCEDDTKQREYLTDCISESIKKENFQFEITCSTKDPHEILRRITDEKELGIFFLDIDLHADINGIELASEIRKIQPRCFIIFVTTHFEMSYMTFSYKVEAMDFIIKDNTWEISNRVHQCLTNCHQLHEQLSEDVTKKYMVKMGDRVKAVPYEDILLFEVSQNSRKVILYAKNCKIEFPGNIKKIEKELDDRFYRCHRSYIINKDNIEEVNTIDNTVMLAGGVSCPMSLRLGKGLRC